MKSSREELPVIIVGGGGHARVVADLLQRLNRQTIGVVDPETTKIGALPWLGPDSVLADWAPEQIELVNGIGSIRPGGSRNAIFANYREKGFRFTTLVHPSASIAAGVVIGMGTVICAGVVIQAGATIGENVILNTHCTVDHDCRIGSDVHISPGAVLCGDVTVGTASHIGAGAIVLQGLTIGQSSLVGAGAVVVADVPTNTVVMGVPARPKS